MSNYLIELSVIHVTLIAGYWFFLRKERQYANMRFYLIGSTLLALAIPLLKLPKLLFSNKAVADVVAMEAISIDAMIVTPTADTSIWTFDLLIWTYGAISAFFLFKFLGGLFYLVWLERRCSREKFNGVHIRKAADIKGSFTFFHWIFLSDDIQRHQRDYEVILKHEEAHASLGHTYDLVFFELFKVCFWWLPTTWFIIREIKKIHEYQADAYALQSCDVDQYASILISSTLETNGLCVARTGLPAEKGPLRWQAGLPAGKGPSRWQAGLTSSFHEGLILKRLAAMKQQAKNVSPWKLGVLSALCALLVLALACSEEVDQEIKEIGSKSNTITFEQLPASMQTELADIKSDLSFMKVEVAADDKISDIRELQDLDPNLIHSVNVDKPNGAIYIALKKDGANFDYLADKSKLEGGVFTIVERQPEFDGGFNGFRGYIMNAIKYPLEARQAGIEGRVDVQFVVGTDGALSDIKVIKGIHPACDQEAVRVLQNAPSFIPGAQNGKSVRVRMVVPVTFKLNEGKINPDQSTQGMVVIDEVQSQNAEFTVKADYADGEWSGTVYDEQGEGLPGVNIVIVGTTMGTVSGLDGKFRLKADKSKDVSLTFVGYEGVRLEGK